MIDLPPTEVLASQVERLQSATGLLHARLARERAWAEYRLELARERDVIQSPQPADCRCLGLGGRRESALTIWDPVDGTTRLVPIWLEPCPHCPAGKAAEAHYQDAHRQARTSAIAHRVRRVFNQPSLADYQDARLATVQVHPANAAAWARIQRWADPSAPESASGLLLFGPVGSGKTYAAVALMRARVELGEMALFLTESDYLQRVRNTYDETALPGGAHGPTTQAVQHAAWSVPLLVLDDLGAEALTPWGETQVRGLLNARLNAQLPTCVTSNSDPVGLRAVREARIVSRLLGLCGHGEYVYEWSGPDRRWEREGS